MDESEEARYEKGTIEAFEKMTDFAGLVVRPPTFAPRFI